MCALITDGRFSGGTAGASIGHVSPEAAVGGPIGLLKNGDVIEIDIPKGVLSVRLSEEELAKRRRDWTPPKPKVTSGYLARYAKMATSADTGAILKWDMRSRSALQPDMPNEYSAALPRRSGFAGQTVSLD